MTIRVKDADDQNPVFTKEIYKASVSESAKLTVSRVHALHGKYPNAKAAILASWVNCLVVFHSFPVVEG